VEIYDGTAWTEMDVDDLKASIAAGRSIEEAAGRIFCAAPAASMTWRGRPKNSA
jgi:hypothetical protein